MMVTGKKHSFAMLSQWLHYLMLVLSLVASLALFLLQSLTYKILLAFILLAYALLLARSSFLRPRPVATPAQHLKIQQWTAPTHINSHQKVPNKQEQTLECSKEVSFLSGNRSMMGREDSFSSFRGLSTSYLNDSHLSGSHRRHLESRGNDLSAILSDRSETKSMGRSTMGADRGIQIMQRKAIARRQLQTWRAQGERGYEEQLVQTKKTAKHVQSRYQVILNSLHSLLNPLLTEHNANTNRLQELSLEFLDITIDQQAEESQSKKAGPIRISSKQLLRRFLEASVRGKPLQLTGLPLRSGKKWNDLEKRINELIRARIRLGESLGVPTEDISSQIRNGVGSFMSRYSTNVNLLEGFVGLELGKKGSQGVLDEPAEESLLREFKSRIFALYIYIRQINGLLRGNLKINLQDQIGLSTLTDIKADIEITAKNSFDTYVPYYNLWVTEGEKKKCYPCEYGPNNYLSLIYFLLFAISSRTEMLRDRPQLTRIINDTL